MNIAEPTGLLSHPGKTKKAAGAAGKANGRELAPGKAKNAFLHVMNARLGAKAAATHLSGVAHALKTAGGAAAAKAAGASMKKPLTAATAHVEATAEPASDARSEKAESRKKSTRLQAHVAGLATAGDASGVGTPAPTDGAAAALKPGAAPQPTVAAAAEGSAASQHGAAAQPAQPRVHVIDLRKKLEGNAGDEAAGGQKITHTLPGDKEASAPFPQRLAALRDAGIPDSQKSASASNAQAQTALDRLRDMAGAELVKASSIVLKDGGGEIRLVLKPESLGSIRIRMNLVDNGIDGKIIVDNSAVKHVIEGSIDALRRALTADGFQTASLQVSVGGQNADAGGGHDQERPAAVRRVAAQGFESNVPGVESMSLGDLLVNLFV